MLPNPKLLEKINHYAKQKGGANYCLFLRVSEAVSFDYQVVQASSFYLVKGKGKMRSVYISQEVIQELKTITENLILLLALVFISFCGKLEKN